MVGNDHIMGRKVNCEIGQNYIYNNLPTGFLVPGGSLKSGLQTIIGIRIQNLKIPIDFHIFYEIPHGNTEYLIGYGLSVDYIF